MLDMIERLRFRQLSALCCALLIVTLPHLALGQEPTVALDRLFIVATPKNPTPGGPVSVEVSSPSVDLSSAEITWLVDGKVVKKGAGERRLNFITRGPGISMRIEARARSGSGTLIALLTIRPAIVDLLFEALTLTPPLFRGRSLYTPQSTVRIVALPEFLDSRGRKLESSRLNYTWKNDGVVLGNFSGVGRQTLIFQGGVLPNPNRITVEVSTTDRTTRGEASIMLRPVQPKVLVFEEHPLYGVRLERSLPPSLLLVGTEVSFRAIPLYFNIENFGSLSYRWFINGKEAEGSKDALTVRREHDERGVSSVFVEVSDPRLPFQRGSYEMSLRLGE